MQLLVKNENDHLEALEKAIRDPKQNFDQIYKTNFASPSCEALEYVKQLVTLKVPSDAELRNLVLSKLENPDQLKAQHKLRKGGPLKGGGSNASFDSGVAGQARSRSGHY